MALTQRAAPARTCEGDRIEFGVVREGGSHEFGGFRMNSAARTSRAKHRARRTGRDRNRQQAEAKGEQRRRNSAHSARARTLLSLAALRVSVSTDEFVIFMAAEVGGQHRRKNDACETQIRAAPHPSLDLVTRFRDCVTLAPLASRSKPMRAQGPAACRREGNSGPVALSSSLCQYNVVFDTSPDMHASPPCSSLSLAVRIFASSHSARCGCCCAAHLPRA